ncbi:MAG: NUMOD4 domain-containing protein [Saprospiraceae bacterium]
MSDTIKNLRNEQWKKVKFSKPTKKNRYEVSNHGRVKSINKLTKKENLILGSKTKRGFRSINVRLADDIYGHLFVHRFVAENFVKKTTKHSSYILHKDYNRDNNKWTNLKWASEEVWKKYIQGMPSYIEGRKKLEKNYKLTASKVKQIKKMLRSGRNTKRKIATKFGVTETQIKRIETGENWGHISI